MLDALTRRAALLPGAGPASGPSPRPGRACGGPAGAMRASVSRRGPPPNARPRRRPLSGRPSLR